MTDHAIHRLEGLEPDNLLAFLALLGLLRILEEARPEWHPRVYWAVNSLPLRPVLRVIEPVSEDDVIGAAIEGLSVLAKHHDFGGLKDLKLSPEVAALRLRRASGADRYRAELWAALVSNAVLARDAKRTEPTPLCLMFGQGHQHFLSHLASVPNEKTAPERGSGRNKTKISEADCLREALFAPWERPDRTSSFRWDPDEDVRYAHRASDPSKARQTTQHGANRLAAVGFSALTVVPRRRAESVHLAVLGGDREQGGSFVIGWPIWRQPVSLAGIRALLGHPHRDRKDVRAALGIVEYRRARRISPGKYMNFTRAEAEYC